MRRATEHQVTSLTSPSGPPAGAGTAPRPRSREPSRRAGLALLTLPYAPNPVNGPKPFRNPIETHSLSSDSLTSMNNPRLAHLAARQPRTALYGLHNHHGAIRYIGTAYNPQQRSRQHWTDARAGYTRRNPELYDWLASLAAPPGVRVLAWLEESERWDTEAWAAASFRRYFPGQLVNMVDGKAGRIILPPLE